MTPDSPIPPKEYDLLRQLQDLSMAVQRCSSVKNVVVLQAAKLLIRDLHRSLQTRLHDVRHHPRHCAEGRGDKMCLVGKNVNEKDKDSPSRIPPLDLLDTLFPDFNVSPDLTAAFSSSEPFFDLLDLVTTPSMESVQHTPLFQRRSLANSATCSLPVTPPPMWTSLPIGEASATTSLPSPLLLSPSSRWSGSASSNQGSGSSHRSTSPPCGACVEETRVSTPQPVAVPIIPQQNTSNVRSLMMFQTYPAMGGQPPLPLLSPSRLATRSFSDSAHQCEPQLTPLNNSPICQQQEPQQRAARSNPQVLIEAIFTVMRGAPPEVIAHYGLGWAALQAIWGITPGHFDPDIMDVLMNRSTARQTEEILLTVAAVDLRDIHNLSAFTSTVIKEHTTMSQVCMRFLAGICHNDQPDHQAHCPFVHPEHTIGWEVLKQRWNVTYRNIDYAAISYLCKQPADTRNRILVAFSEMNLKNVKNLSAYLSRAIRTNSNSQP